MAGSFLMLVAVERVKAKKYIARLEPQVSQGNALIQLADMICGAVARPYNKPHRKGLDHLETIKHRVNSVLEWP